jgi:hypothetical protein
VVRLENKGIYNRPGEALIEHQGFTEGIYEICGPYSFGGYSTASLSVCVRTANSFTPKTNKCVFS